jgi:SPP1 family predicted phage head-tail adaptor
MIEAGKLRHRITIKALQESQNGFGEETGMWNDVVSIRASKEPLLGNEYFNAVAMHSKVEVKFRARYISGIENKTNMRIYHGNEIYDILSAINVRSLNKELLIYCKFAGTDDG